MDISKTTGPSISYIPSFSVIETSIWLSLSQKMGLKCQQKQELFLYHSIKFSYPDTKVTAGRTVSPPVQEHIWAVSQENVMHTQWPVTWPILEQKYPNEGGLVQRGGSERTRDSDLQDGRCKDEEELGKSYRKTKTVILSLWPLRFRKPEGG